MTGNYYAAANVYCNLYSSASGSNITRERVVDIVNNAGRYGARSLLCGGDSLPRENIPCWNFAHRMQYVKYRAMHAAVIKHTCNHVTVLCPFTRMSHLFAFKNMRQFVQRNFVCELALVFSWSSNMFSKFIQQKIRPQHLLGFFCYFEVSLNPQLGPFFCSLFECFYCIVSPQNLYGLI